MIMKKAYIIFMSAMSVMALAWFLPWLYDLAFPSAASEPFVAYSPVADDFVVSDNSERLSIRLAGDKREYTKEQRDSLLPQIYFTQLAAREQLPDSIGGREVSLPILKHTQWVFSSLPLDINKVQPDWHLIMESMPTRFDLEDPTEAFSLSGGEARFVTMDGNATNEKRSRRFTKALADKGFVYPPTHMSANITARKPYDEGYLIVDAEGKVFHMKMRAGTPYVARANMPAAKYAFVLENPDRRLLGIVVDRSNNIYALERDGYRAIPLDINVDVARSRLTVMANVFNIVVRSRCEDAVDWWAVDADSYKPLGHYRHVYPASVADQAVEWIFPFRLSFTDVNDCYARPRIDGWSGRALAFSAVLAVVVYLMGWRRKYGLSRNIALSICAFVFGIYFFVVYLLIKN